MRKIFNDIGDFLERRWKRLRIGLSENLIKHDVIVQEEIAALRLRIFILTSPVSNFRERHVLSCSDVLNKVAGVSNFNPFPIS